MGLSIVVVIFPDHFTNRTYLYLSELMHTPSEGRE
jgi:hypothetical protein